MSTTKYDVSQNISSERFSFNLVGIVLTILSKSVYSEPAAYRRLRRFADSTIIKIINFNLILFLNKKSLATGTSDSEGGLKPELI